MSKLIFIQDIDTEHSPLVRHKINEDVVEDYAEIYRAKKVKLPPIQVFTEDGKVFLLADGMHRVAAVESLGQKMVEAEINKGGYEEALKFALVANERHGLRRTVADKRRCVQQAITQWPKVADLQIANLCSVDPKTVKAVREELEAAGEVKKEVVRETTDGRKIPATKPRKEAGEAKPKEAIGKSQPAVHKDGNGKVVPQFCVPYWERRQEVQEMIESLDAVARALRVFQKNEDLMYGEVNFSACLADLQRVWTNLGCAIPFAVCTQCQGQPQTQPKGECRLCKGRGLISRFRWDTVVPAEIKRLSKKP
jgi:hypothetical protein